MNEDLLQTLQAHFHSQFLKARTNLNVYLSSSVGVGEHGDVVSESIRHIEEMEHNRSCVELLQEIIQANQQAQQAQQNEPETQP
jgi:hypothetical protein